MIESNLPALIVVVPLLAALVTPLLSRRGVPWAWATLTMGAVLAMAITLVIKTGGGTAGVISYPMGGWSRSWSIEYLVDSANAFVLLIIAAIAAVVTFYARPASRGAETRACQVGDGLPFP